jgi:hypothetical protein
MEEAYLMHVPDREKQRREYLKKKAGSYGTKVMVFGLFLFLLLPTITCGLFTIISLFVPALQPSAIGFAMSALFFGFWCRFTYWFVKRADTEIAAIPFIPPVTASTLPAEEVLVRGAQEPSQEQSTVLLRASGESTEVPVEELLRAIVAEKGTKL